MIICVKCVCGLRTPDVFKSTSQVGIRVSLVAGRRGRGENRTRFGYRSVT